MNGVTPFHIYKHFRWFMLRVARLWVGLKGSISRGQLHSM